MSETEVSNRSHKYFAFISYSHQDNRTARASGEKGRVLWANWLHHALETYRIPAELVGKQSGRGETIPARLFPVFRDEAELPTNPDLGSSIREALAASRSLIVICSPRSARSVYCNEEVRYFKELGRGDSIYPIIIDGEPNASDAAKPGVAPTLECFVPALRHPVQADGTLDFSRRDVEPICADVRLRDDFREPDEQGWKRDRDRQQGALLKIVAGLLGVGYDDLVKRDQKRQLEEQKKRAKRARLVATAFAVLAVVAIVVGYYANKKRVEVSNQAALVAQKEASRQLQIGRPDLALGYLAYALRFQPGNQRISYSALSILGAYSPVIAATPMVHGEWINDAVFSPDSSKVLTLASGSARLWNLQGLPLLEPIKQPNDVVTSAAYSPDGRSLVTGSHKGIIQFWDAQTGKPLGAQLRHQELSQILNGIQDIAFSPDGTRMATAADGGIVQLWDAKTRQPVGEPMRHDGYVYDVAFSPDGKLIATTGSDSAARLWDAHTGRPFGPLSGTRMSM